MSYWTTFERISNFYDTTALSMENIAQQIQIYALNYSGL